MANDDRLSREQRRFLALLALPAIGIAFSYTIVTTYLPVLIHLLSGPAATGILLGGEGIFALVRKVLRIGREWSSRTPG